MTVPGESVARNLRCGHNNGELAFYAYVRSPALLAARMGKSMPLIYTTSDRGFADRAVQTLLSHGIQAYRTGEDLSGYIVGPSSQYCVHIESDSERARANELLLQMGAAPEEPLHLPTGPWVRWAMLVAGICLGTVVILLLT